MLKKVIAFDLKCYIFIVFFASLNSFFFSGCGFLLQKKVRVLKMFGFLLFFLAETYICSCIKNSSKMTFKAIKSPRICIVFFIPNKLNIVPIVLRILNYKLQINFLSIALNYFFFHFVCVNLKVMLFV